MGCGDTRFFLSFWSEDDDPGTADDRDPIDRLASADDLNAIWMMSQHAAFGGNPGDALAYLSSRNPHALDGDIRFHPVTRCAALARRLLSTLTGSGAGPHTRAVGDAGEARGTERPLYHRIEPS